MQQISFHIPDKHMPFIMELLQNFDFVKIDPATLTLSKKQKALVEAERLKSKKAPGYLLDWEKVKHTLKKEIRPSK